MNAVIGFFIVLGFVALIVFSEYRHGKSKAEFNAQIDMLKKQIAEYTQQLKDKLAGK